MNEEEIIKRYWEYRNIKEPINYNEAREIEADFKLLKDKEWISMNIKFFCPFCDNEIEASDECQTCGAKVIYQDGGNYCPHCESTYYFTNNKEDIKKLKELE